MLVYLDRKIHFEKMAPLTKGAGMSEIGEGGRIFRKGYCGALTLVSNSYEAIPNTQGCMVVILGTCAISLGDSSQFLRPLIAESLIMRLYLPSYQEENVFYSKSVYCL